MRTTSLIFLFFALWPVAAFAAGNQTIESYSEAKRLLYEKVYQDHRITIYCGAIFDENRSISLSHGFIIPSQENRAYRAETEHIVAVENFGRAFEEWREGAPQCVDSRGERFKGRKCAETKRDFRLMEADLHNLAPAIGAVNALRRNYRFGILPNASSNFGSCPMKIQGRLVEPPDQAKGIVARTHLYMADAYAQHFRLSHAQRKLFEAWNNRYPPDEWECERERRIANIQGNPNIFTAKWCSKDK